ncbi:MAG: DNA gyrase inhibitor YacG [Pseudomonadota bacterium]
MSCPICAAPTVHAYRPFCSRRCADMDLARWLNGSYAVPAEEEDAPDELDAEREARRRG